MFDLIEDFFQTECLAVFSDIKKCRQLVSKDVLSIVKGGHTHIFKSTVKCLRTLKSL